MKMPSKSSSSKANTSKTTKSAATPRIATAKTYLKQAIELHEKHMEGKAPTTGKAGEKSQQKMMVMMEKAEAALEGKK